MQMEQKKIRQKIRSSKKSYHFKNIISQVIFGPYVKPFMNECTRKNAQDQNSHLEEKIGCCRDQEKLEHIVEVIWIK
jgi:hypothetical protein